MWSAERQPSLTEQSRERGTWRRKVPCSSQQPRGGQEEAVPGFWEAGCSRASGPGRQRCDGKTRADSERRLKAENRGLAGRSLWGIRERWTG